MSAAMLIEGLVFRVLVPWVVLAIVFAVAFGMVARAMREDDLGEGDQ